MASQCTQTLPCSFALDRTLLGAPQPPPPVLHSDIWIYLLTFPLPPLCALDFSFSCLWWPSSLFSQPIFLCDKLTILFPVLICKPDPSDIFSAQSFLAHWIYWLPDVQNAPWVLHYMLVSFSLLQQQPKNWNNCLKKMKGLSWITIWEVLIYSKLCCFGACGKTAHAALPF